jgi:hypothetical protein
VGRRLGSGEEVFETEIRKEKVCEVEISIRKGLWDGD